MATHQTRIDTNFTEPDTIDRLHHPIWGDKVKNIPPSDSKTFRLLSHNVNGITRQGPNDRTREILHGVHATFQASAISFTETNVDWSHLSCSTAWTQTTRSLWPHTRSATSNAPNILRTNTYQPGGTCTAILGKWATRVTDSGSDRLLGRFSWITLEGKQDSRLTIITGYRVGNGSHTTDILRNTARAQQSRILRAQGSTANPRHRFIDDIITLIQDFQDRSHHIILSWDANEPLISDQTTEVERVLIECGLVDIHTECHQDPDQPATHSAGSNKIDFVFCSPDILDSVTAATIAPFNLGYHSDHRALIVDFDAQRLFGGTTSQIDPTARRKLVSTNPRVTKKYIEHSRQAYESNRIAARAASLQQAFALEGATDSLIAQYIALDQQITEILLAAENYCSRHIGGNYPWSPEYWEGSTVLRYWITRLSQLRTGIDSSQILDLTLQLLESRAPKNEHLPNMRLHSQTKAFLLEQTQRARTDMKRIRIEAQELREKFLKERSEYHAMAKKKSAEGALKSIISAESSSRLFRSIRNAFKGIQCPGLDRVQVQRTPLPATAGNQTNAPTPAPITEWESSKEGVHAALTSANPARFRGHAPTPFGHGDRLLDIGSDCTSPSVAAILEGTYGYRIDELGPEQKEWIRQLQRRTPTKPSDKVDIDITTNDFVDAWAKFRESTASSPSGRHYGHYKVAATAYTVPEKISLAKDAHDNPFSFRDLAIVHAIMASLPLKHGFSHPRWQRSINLMLEKASGSRLVDKLRIIHLFEADLNFVFKLIWGKRLMRHAENQGYLGHDQHGSRPGRRANDAALEKTLAYEYARVTRTSMITIDNDAKSCYDRIIRVLGMTACMCMGLPLPAASMHNLTHDHMTHQVRTLHGISAESYSATNDEPLEGSGQGSGGSPCIWNVISVTLTDAYSKFTKGIRIFDPLRTLCTRIVAIFYVDDNTPGINDAEDATPEPEGAMIQRAQTNAQSWANLLSGSGGALEPSKCFTYIVRHDWKSGRPSLRKPEDIATRVVLQDSITLQQYTLACVDPHIGTRSLGIRMAPSGTFETEYLHRFSQAKAMAHNMISAKFSHAAADLAFRSIITPAIEYPLGMVHFTSKQCHQIQSQILRATLPKMGYSRTLPRAIVFGPAELGGIGLHEHYIEQCIQHITTMMGHIRQPGRTGDMIRCTLRWQQRLAGTTVPILEQPSQNLKPLLETGWITAVRDSLHATGLTLQFTDPSEQSGPTEQKLREFDEHIMDKLLTRYSGAALYKINACRLYLRVSRLSEITSADGKNLKPGILDGTAATRELASITSWPRQENPNRTWWNTWSKAIRNTYTTDGSSTALRLPLGKWTAAASTMTQGWPQFYDPLSNKLFIRNEIGWTRHKAIESAHGRMRYELHSVEPILADVPETAVPADQLVRQNRRQISFTVRLPGTPQTLPRHEYTRTPTSFASYLESQPLLTRRLMFRLGENGIEEAQIEQMRLILSDPQGSILGASDGGLKFSIGAFGWLWYDLSQNRPTKIFGSGPSDTAPAYQTSDRVEITGILSALTFLRLMFEYHGITAASTLQIRLVSDSKEALRCATTASADKDWFTTSRSWKNYDLFCEIKACISSISTKIKFQWIKGHQTKLPNHHNPPSKEARLNDDADALATAFLRDRIKADLPLFGELWPHQKIVLLDDGLPITGDIAKSIRKKVQGSAIQKYYCSRFEWTTETWKTIDHDASAKTSRKLSPPDRRRLIQLRCQWLPTNKRLSKFTEDRSPYCPRCSTHPDPPVEDINHLLRCPECVPPWSTYISTTLTDELIKHRTHPAMQQAFRGGLTHWADGNDTEYVWSPTSGDERVLTLIHAAVRSQNKIGWKGILQGFFSCHWNAVHESLKQTKEGERDRDSSPRTNWSEKVFTITFKYFNKNWSHRNSVLFGKDPAEQRTILRQKLLQKIRNLYKLRDTLLEADQRNLFSCPEARLQTGSINEMQNFLAHVLEGIPKAISRKDRLPAGQRTMTDFFTRSTDFIPEPGGNG
jgi:ribonuclease HI